MTAALGSVMELAPRQACIVTTADLTARGVAPTAIRRLVDAGVLRRLHRGVYLAGPTEPPNARAMAALLACGTGAALSHRTAGELWGMLPPGGGPIDVTRPGGARTHHGVRAHRGRLEPRDVGRHHGMSVTRPARTLLDLARVLGPHALDRALEEAQVLRLVSDAELYAILERARARPGVRALRHALPSFDATPSLTRSEAELRLLGLVRAARLPAPVSNVRVCRREVDLLWPAQRLVVEVDGFRFHGGRAAFERDRRRDGELLASGYRVLRVTWRELTGAPEAVVATLAQALAAHPA